MSFLRRFIRYSDKVFGLERLLASLSDSRPRPTIPTRRFARAFFLLFATRQPSFNALASLDQKHARRWLGGKMPCANELAYVSERLDPRPLRQALLEIRNRLRRNKVLGPFGRHTLAAIDGHEVNWSTARRCQDCLARTVRTGDREVVQHHHRLVALQIIGPGFPLLVDHELLRPGEDEVAAATRLITRVLDDHPRCFDVLTADAAYMEAPFLAFLRSRGKDLVAVLKENQPELLSEARRLMAAEPPVHVDTRREKGRDRTVLTRDMEGFTTEAISEPLRVVWEHHDTTVHERVGGKLETREEESDWFLATTLGADVAPTRVGRFGHERWRVENEGFNELATRWHSGHIHHHHPNTLTVLWLMMFLVLALFQCFLLRNLKAQARRGKSTTWFAERMRADLFTGAWPPPI